MININCDLGEGLSNEQIIMPLINSCNIACGGHAGDNESMIECVEMSIRNKAGLASKKIEDNPTVEKNKLSEEKPELPRK